MSARRPFPLYHWSPVARRASILRHGLRPGSLSRCGQWKPPYICLSDSPSRGWGLSGAMDDAFDQWDLWMVWSNAAGRLRRRKDGGKVVIEYRAFDPIPKRHVWWVGSRGHRVPTPAS